MSVEPYAVRFQIGTRVMPPAESKTPARPKLTMMQDAALIRARFKRVMGSYFEQGGDNEANIRRKDEAQQRRAALAKGILTMTAETGATVDQISKAMNATEHQVKQVLRRLGKEGKVKTIRRNRGGWLWVKA